MLKSLLGCSLTGYNNLKAGYTVMNRISGYNYVWIIVNKTADNKVLKHLL